MWLACLMGNKPHFRICGKITKIKAKGGKMAKKIWIVYKTESMSAPGWEERQLMPRGGLTNILWENWTWEENPEIPQVGDKTRDYENLSDPGNGVTHGKDGDWVVTSVQQFSSVDTEERIVVCYCSYQPVASHWEALQQRESVNQMLATIEQY